MLVQYNPHTYQYDVFEFMKLKYFTRNVTLKDCTVI